MNWRRGAFRLWMLASVLWCAGVFVDGVRTMDVAWPLSDRVVELKFTDGETRRYPATWGRERITAAANQRGNEIVEAEIAKTKRCSTEPRPKDCKYWEGNSAIPRNEREWYPLPLLGPLYPPLSIWEAMAQRAPQLAPMALGPPLLVLAVGAALFWALAGFRS